MKEEDEKGEQPLNRPRGCAKNERTMTEKRKRQSWSRKGGYIVPIFVLARTKCEFAAQLRGISESESEAVFKLRIFEDGGRTIKSHFQKSNPISSQGCDNVDCLACQDGKGKGGSCLRSNIQYELSCNQCPEAVKCVYIGETDRNLYKRAESKKGSNLPRNQI